MSVKLIAYYLPQYHPIPENDEWWGKGFTEWTNVAKAKPLFKGHYQPRLPADLGFYDLRVPEVRDQQAELAREHGIYGFCYYHYWFGNGKQLLERPFNDVLASGKPDFPFMLCWANQSWKGVWFGASKGKMLIDQHYPGADDYKRHFYSILNALNDPRYICIDNKPVFFVYMPREIPDLNLFVDVFRGLAFKEGLTGIYLLAGNCPDTWIPSENGFDGMISSNFHTFRNEMKRYLIKNNNVFLGKVERKLRRMFFSKGFDDRNKPFYVEYSKLINLISNWPEVNLDYFPEVVPDWDNSPRSGVRSLIIKNSTPDLWREHLTRAFIYALKKPADRQFVFIKSWNEWAESNYLEPDLKYGHTYLEMLKKTLQSFSKDDI